MPTQQPLGVQGNQSWSWMCFELLRVAGLPETTRAATNFSSLSSPLVWEIGMLSFLSLCFSFPHPCCSPSYLFPPSVQYWASTVSPDTLPFTALPVIPCLARQGKAASCATWQELPGVEVADNSHFYCLLSTVMKLQVSVAGAELSGCALLFFLLLHVFSSAEIRTGLQN